MKKICGKIARRSERQKPCDAHCIDCYFHAFCVQWTLDTINKHEYFSRGCHFPHFQSHCKYLCGSDIHRRNCWLTWILPISMHCQLVMWKLTVYSLIGAQSRSIGRNRLVFQFVERLDKHRRPIDIQTDKIFNERMLTSRLVQLTTITHFFSRAFFFFVSNSAISSIEKSKTNKNVQMICSNRSISINLGGRFADEKPILIFE